MTDAPQPAAALSLRSSGAEDSRAETLDRALDAALALAADRSWRDIALRDIALSADVAFAALYARTPSKAVLLDHLSRRYDEAALATASDLTPDAADRLFEAAMARLEAMAPARDALIAIARAESVTPRAVGRVAVTARALLEAAGIDTSGLRGALRLSAMTRAWARILIVWRDDEGALNRTMAEIDRLIKAMRRRLERVGAGF